MGRAFRACSCLRPTGSTGSTCAAMTPRSCTSTPMVPIRRAARSSPAMTAPAPALTTTATAWAGTIPASGPAKRRFWLTNGTPYWVEAVMMEGTGSDYMQVVMTAIDPGSQTDIGGVPAVAVGAALSGGFFSAPGNPDLNKLLFLSSPPANQLLGENDLANLTVLPSIVPPALSAYAAFQWQRSNGLGGFTNVPGGNVPALPNYYARLSDDNATFRFLASIPGTNAVLM